MIYHSACFERIQTHVDFNLYWINFSIFSIFSILSIHIECLFSLIFFFLDWIFVMRQSYTAAVQRSYISVMQRSYISVMQRSYVAGHIKNKYYQSWALWRNFVLCAFFSLWAIRHTIFVIVCVVRGRTYTHTYDSRNKYSSRRSPCDSNGRPVALARYELKKTTS